MYCNASYQQARSGGERYAPANIFRGRCVYFQIILSFSLVVIGAANSSGQGLGALAREEQARKQAQPTHQGHIYTNDDLVRPQILTPNDDVEFRSARKRWRPTNVEVPPELVIESDPPEVPLGDIARQYSEQKVARQQQSRMEAQPIRSSHVYTNEDMARAQILTPEDHAIFEAAQKNWLPAIEHRPHEILSRELDLPSAPLGDIARLYRQRKPVPEIQQARGFRLLLGTTPLASPMIPRSPTRLPPRTWPVPHPTQVRQRNQRSTKPGNTVAQLVTVKSGDSLWGLARQYLGQGHRWRALWKASPWIRDPNYLRVGSHIRI